MNSIGSIIKLALASAALSVTVASLAMLGVSRASAQAVVSAPLVAGEGRRVALALAERLGSDYTYPDIGRRYQQSLSAKAAAGDYDGLTDQAALAAALTADVQAIHVDKHIKVRTGAPQPRGTRPAMSPIADERWLAPGVAYIRFNMFAPDPQSVAETTRFMAEHTTAKTLIFDLRTHRGGGIDMMNAILPYLYSKPTPLVTLVSRTAVEARQGSPFEDGDATIRRIEAPEGLIYRQHVATPGSDRRLARAKVYLLTSPVTASAAEHFALSLKRTHRATLIGSATSGANHFGSHVPIAAGYIAFIPVGRTLDPDTGKDWESVGVAPDVVVAPEAALRKALEMAGLSGADAQRLSDSVRPAASLRAS